MRKKIDNGSWRGRLACLALSAILSFSTIPVSALAEVASGPAPKAVTILSPTSEMSVKVESTETIPSSEVPDAESEVTAKNGTAPEAAQVYADAAETGSANSAQTTTSPQQSADGEDVYKGEFSTKAIDPDGLTTEDVVKLQVRTSDSARGVSLDGAQLEARQLAGKELASVVSSLGQAADGRRVDAYDVQLLSGGRRLELQKADEVTAWLPKRDGATVYRVKDGVATKLDASVDDSNDLLKADVDDLGTLVVTYPYDGQAASGEKPKDATPEVSAASEEKDASAPAATEDTAWGGSATEGTAASSNPLLGSTPLTDKPTSPDGAEVFAASLSGEPSGSAELLASSAELAPGKYIVSANVSMLTPLGFPGYTTNPFNPEGLGGKAGVPATPVTDNATLVVGKDGTRTLTVNLVNPVFTVQNAESGEGVTVLNALRKDIEKKTAEDDAHYKEYNQSIADAGVTSRVCQLTVNLENWSGSYSFGNWKVYATTLKSFFPSPDPKFSGIKSLDLSVDLARATKVVEGDFSRTFKDEKTGVEVEVSVEEGSSVAPKLQNAELRVDAIEGGSAHEAASGVLAQLYPGRVYFKMYDLQLVSGGRPIEPDSKVAFRASVPVESDDASLYAFAAGRLTDMAASVESGRASFEPKTLGNFIKVENQSAKKRWSHTFMDTSTDVSMTYASDGTFEFKHAGANNPEEGVKLLDWYKDFFALAATSSFEESYANKAVGVTEGADPQAKVKASGTYAASWVVKPMQDNDPFYNVFPFYKDDADRTFVSQVQTNPLSATIPVKSPGASVYLVTGTVGDGADSAKKLDATIVDGHAVVPLDNESVGISDCISRMFNVVYKTSGGVMSGQPQDATTPVAYLVVVEPAAKLVNKPVAASGLVYNGKEQVGVPEGEGYDLASGKASSTGAHKSVATLREGYAWSDGSTTPVVLDWTIDKATLTATYKGETITVGEKPALLVDVTGFVNGETPETADGYVAPKVLASSLEEGRHDLKPSGGSADNYRFGYVGGALIVKEKAASGEQKLTPGTYTITANLAMPGRFNPLIPGLTVYANSPNNPFGPTIDENKDVDVQAEIPRVPLSMNAQLVVSKDGTRTLVLPIRNPIFTTQEIGTCDQLSDVRAERVKPTVSGGDWSGSYNKRTDRIHMMSAVLPAGQAKGTATFDFKGSVLYAVPLDRELRPEGDVALQLTVDYDSVAKASDSTDLPAFAKAGNGGNGGSTTPGGNSGGTTPSNQGGSGNASKPQPNAKPGNATQGKGDGSNGTNASGKDAGDPISSTNGHLAAGSYTVSANIWVNREEAGLPLSPHFTNSSFPPSSSVTKNATLNVESDGHAYVTVPIIIQSRIMHVLSISGLDIVSSSRDGEGGLSSITVDLGILRDASDITKTATASIRLGSLASSIIGGPADRTWSVTFEVVFNGAPTQTGGTLPKAALDIINAQGSDGKAASGKAQADAAAADALAALDAQGEAKTGGASRPSNSKGAPKGGEEVARSNPALAVGLALLALAVATGAVIVVRRHRKESGGDDGANVTTTLGTSKED